METKIAREWTDTASARPFRGMESTQTLLLTWLLSVNLTPHKSAKLITGIMTFIP